MTGSSFPSRAACGEVPGVALERLILLLGRLVGHPMGATHLLQRLPEIVGGDAPGAEQRAGGGALLLGQRQQQMLGGDVGVAHLPGLGLGPVEDALELPG